MYVCGGKKLELLNPDSNAVPNNSRFHENHLLGKEINHDFTGHVVSKSPVHSWSQVLKSELTWRGCSMKSCSPPFPFSFALPPEIAWINGIIQSFSVNTSSNHFSSKICPTENFASHLPKSVCAPDVSELSV